MIDIAEVKSTLATLTERHQLQRDKIGKVRKHSKISSVWLLEGMSLSLLNRAAKQYEASDIVMYELVSKARLAQECNLMIRHILSQDTDANASQSWGRALAYYVDRKSEIKYRQYKGKDIYNEIEKSFFEITSLWAHASYDNARTSFMYTNKDPAIYNINYVLDNSIHDNMRWVQYIVNYTNQSFFYVDEFLDENK